MNTVNTLVKAIIVTSSVTKNDENVTCAKASETVPASPKVLVPMTVGIAMPWLNQVISLLNVHMTILIASKKLLLNGSLEVNKLLS